MSTTNALAQIKPADCARADRNDSVTEVEAEAAALNLGMTPAEIQNLKRVTNKNIIGKYLARERYGAITYETEDDKAIANGMIKLMADIAGKDGQDGKEKEPSEIRIMAVNTAAKMIQTKTDLNILQLKAVEIGGHSPRQRSLQPVGPPDDIEV